MGYDALAWNVTVHGRIPKPVHLFILISILYLKNKKKDNECVLGEQFAAPKLVELAAEPTKASSEAEPVITPGGRQAFRLLSGSGWSMPGQ